VVVMKPFVKSKITVSAFAAPPSAKQRANVTTPLINIRFIIPPRSQLMGTPCRAGYAQSSFQRSTPDRVLHTFHYVDNKRLITQCKLAALPPTSLCANVYHYLSALCLILA